MLKCEIALWHGCSPVNLLNVFRAPFPKNTSGRLLLEMDGCNQSGSKNRQLLKNWMAKEAFPEKQLFSKIMQLPSINYLLNMIPKRMDGSKMSLH